MSVHTHDADPLARSPADVDPTRTKTLRSNYASRLRGRLAKLNAVIRETVGSDDLFGLRRDTLQPVPPQSPAEGVYRFATDDEKIEAFMDWLRRQERRGILEVIHRDENTFIRQAYATGIRHADRALNAEGVTVPDRDLQALFNTPMHREALQTLFTRNFSELDGVTDAMNQQISRELADGFSRGLNPTTMARNIMDRINKIGKHRATVLARTETIRAHSTATLNRYEEFNVDEITVQAEWLTAGDARVCPICQALEGRTWTITEARESTVQLAKSDISDFVPENRSASSFTGEFPVQPPAHPQCRCSLIPEVT